MKLYNDVFEEKERCQVLQKIGMSKRSLKRSMAKELSFCYLAPSTLMAISSYFYTCIRKYDANKFTSYEHS